TLGGRELRARVLLGTARYPSRACLFDALAAAEVELATVSLRRVAVTGDEGGGDLYGELTARGYQILPNTAGCFTADDAVLTAELAREALHTDLIKLEVIADEETLL